jgi:hypothetical protein
MRPKAGAKSRRAGAAVANLSQSISNPLTQTAVQTIQAKINELLHSLMAAGIISP